MSLLSPVVIEQVLQIARDAEAAGHGQKSAIYETGARQLNLSVQTLHRHIKKLTVKQARKRRADAGKCAATREELELVSALIIESIRKNDKQLSSVALAVERLRANGKILCGQVDTKTGEIKLMSTSAITTALHRHQLHPSQLLQPPPAIELASKHPNHCFQGDASISTQFYLANDGVRRMIKSVHYDGKPQNMEKIKEQRLWRYVITDHATGAIYLEYVLGAESAENLCNVLINAMQKRPGNPFHGVPFIFMTDPGAAMTSAVFRNLCKNLSIDLIINKPGNARAKGQVEQAHNIVERQFESALKLVKAESLEQINQYAARWMHYYNATAIHSRHGRTRYDAWMTIKPEQLRIAPPVEVCQALAVTAPEERTVTTKLRISFRGGEYDVSTVPHVLVGEKLLIARNPWNDEETAKVVLTDENGREFFHVINKVDDGYLGFATNAAIIGESLKSHAPTDAQLNRQKLEQIATGTDSVEAAEAARKAGKLPFGGLDPHKHITDAVLPDYLPRRGVELEPAVIVPKIEESKLTVFALAKQLKERLPAWTADHYQWLQREYPEGAPESQLDDILSRIHKRPMLTVVGGQ